MQTEVKTLIIIPAYNEAKNIAQVIATTRTSAPLADVLVVNDGSADDTAAVARQAGARVISLPFNMGYGVALQTGYKYALKRGYDCIVQMDADGQHEAQCIPALLEALREEQADVVIGSRFLEDCGYHTSFAKRVGMLIFGTLASLITGQRITDPNSGFQALSKDVVRFCASDVYPVDYPDADAIIMLHRAGFRIKEVPVVMYVNPSGKSMHAGWRPVYYVFKMFLSIFVTLLRRDTASKEGRA